MRVIAVDPGLRSGICWWYEGESVEFAAKILDPLPVCDVVWDTLRDRTIDAVVCESYTITTQTAKLSAQNWSLEIIGQVRWACSRYRVPFVLQKPADAKTFMPDQRLKDLGFWVSGKEDHARDAARHLGLYLAKSGQIKVPPLRLTPGPGLGEH